MNNTTDLSIGHAVWVQCKVIQTEHPVEGHYQVVIQGTYGDVEGLVSKHNLRGLLHRTDDQVEGVVMAVEGDVIAVALPFAIGAKIFVADVKADQLDLREE